MWDSSSLCVATIYFLIAVCYSILWIYHNLFILFTVGRYLDSFQFVAVITEVLWIVLYIPWRLRGSGTFLYNHWSTLLPIFLLVFFPNRFIEILYILLIRILSAICVADTSFQLVTYLFTLKSVFWWLHVLKFDVI